jgi:hypothetical protein
VHHVREHQIPETLQGLLDVIGAGEHVRDFALGG